MEAEMRIRPSPDRPDKPTLSEEYRAYLASPAWDRTRRAALDRARWKCAVCGLGHDLEIHHKTYERLGAEAWGDLICLCRLCHLAADRRRSRMGAWR
jgi:5-methylcytosine-specific restriction endonuclease McrA